MARQGSTPLPHAQPHPATHPWVLAHATQRLELLLLCQIIRQVESSTNLLWAFALYLACERARCEVHNRTQPEHVGGGGQLAQLACGQRHKALVKLAALLWAGAVVVCVWGGG